MLLYIKEELMNLDHETFNAAGVGHVGNAIGGLIEIAVQISQHIK